MNSLTHLNYLKVEEKPDVTYNDVGGCKEQIEKLREVVETPLLHPEKFVNLGIDPPKGVLLFGPPGTGTCSRKIDFHTNSVYIFLILLQFYLIIIIHLLTETLPSNSRINSVTFLLFSIYYNFSLLKPCNVLQVKPCVLVQ